MTASWSQPDPRGTVAVAPLFAEAVPVAEAGPPLRDDLRAGALTTVVTVLAGAPVGLLWAALAPRVDVVVRGTETGLADPSSSAFIAGDAYFLGAVLLAGLVTGVVAWRLARAHGPAVVTGLTVGGLLAAVVAMVVGQAVGADDVRAAVEAARQGPLTLSLRLRAREAFVGWPIGALLGYLSASLVRGR